MDRRLDPRRRRHGGPADRDRRLSARRRLRGLAASGDRPRAGGDGRLLPAGGVRGAVRRLRRDRARRWSRAGRETALAIPGDIIIGRGDGRRPERIEAPLVFVGYGLHMPEAGHDDFAGVDLKGKIAVVDQRRPRRDFGRAQGACPPRPGEAAFRAGRRRAALADHRQGGGGALGPLDGPGRPVRNVFRRSGASRRQDRILQRQLQHRDQREAVRRAPAGPSPRSPRSPTPRSRCPGST